MESINKYKNCNIGEANAVIKNNGGSIVIHDGNTRLINVKDTDVLTKVLDMLPEVVNKITKPKKGEVTDQEAKDAAFPEENL